MKPVFAYRIFALALLATALPAAPAQASATHLGRRGPAPSIGSCRAGAITQLATRRCANGWSRPDQYQPWNEGGNATPIHIPFREEGYEVLGVSPDTRMVQIAVGNQPVWIGADALDCESLRNAGTAVVPNDDPGAFCPMPNAPVDTSILRQAHVAAGEPARDFILAKAQRYADLLHQRVKNDNTLLVDRFKDGFTSDQERYAALRHARDRMFDLYTRASASYPNDCQGPPPGSPPEIARERAERACRTFRDTLHFLDKIVVGRSPEEALGEIQPFLRDTLDDSNSAAAQVNVRTALYYALGLDSPAHLSPELTRLRNSLQVVRKGATELGEVERAGGKPDGGTFDEPFGGYLYGNTGRPGDPTECAGFALHYVLGMSRQATRGGKGPIPTVWDFENLHRYLEQSDEAHVFHLRQPDPPPYFAEYSSCFTVVNLRAGDEPMPGDFVSRHGHIVIVRDYDPYQRAIDTIEAASGPHSTVGYFRRSLYEPACEGSDPSASTDWRIRPQLSDLRVLRYAPRTGRALHPGEHPCPIHLSAPGL